MRLRHRVLFLSLCLVLVMLAITSTSWACLGGLLPIAPFPEITEVAVVTPTPPSLSSLIRMSGKFQQAFPRLFFLLAGLESTHLRDGALSRRVRDLVYSKDRLYFSIEKQLYIVGTIRTAGDTLTMDIENVRLTEYEYGRTASAGDTRFAEVLIGILEGAAMRLQTHPELKIVHILATKVRNKPLAVLLNKWGFVSVERNRALTRAELDAIYGDGRYGSRDSRHNFYIEFEANPDRPEPGHDDAQAE